MGTEFRVASVFTRSCYLVSVTGDWICLLPETATADPLGVRLRVSGGVDWHASGVAAGMHCWCGVSALYVGARLAIHLSDAPTWTPSAPPPCNRVSLMRGLNVSRCKRDDTGCRREAGVAVARLPCSWVC